MEPDYLESATVKRSKARRDLKIEFVLRAYSIFGGLMTLGALAYLGLSFLPYELSYRQQLALMVAGVGMVLAVLSRLVITLRRTREFELELEDVDRRRLADFIATWAQFELASKEALKVENTSAERLPIRAVLASLLGEGKITKDDLEVLDESLRVRNAIVHGGTVASPNTLARLTETLNGIIGKIAYLPH